MAAAEIARCIGGGISERVVRYRIDRMVKDEVIQIRPIVNPQAFGLTIRADVLLEVESDAIMAVPIQPWHTIVFLMLPVTLARWTCRYNLWRKIPQKFTCLLPR